MSGFPFRQWLALDNNSSYADLSLEFADAIAAEEILADSNPLRFRSNLYILLQST